MHLSELQTKEVINIITGSRLGIIVDVILGNDGYIKELVLEEKRAAKRFLTKEEIIIKWQQIIKIGDDIILVDTNK